MSDKKTEINFEKSLEELESIVDKLEMNKCHLMI